MNRRVFLLLAATMGFRALATCPQAIEQSAYFAEPEVLPAVFLRKQVSDSDIAQARAELSNLSAKEMAFAAFEKYLEFRLRGAPPEVHAEIRRLLSELDLSISDDEYSASGQYEGSSGGRPARIVLSVHSRRYGTGLYYKDLAHEVEHALQAADPDCKASSGQPQAGKEMFWEEYLKEVGAVRAEYEYLQLLPPEAIEICRQVTRQMPESHFIDPDPGLLDALPLGFSEFRRQHPYSDYESVYRQYQRFIFGH